MAKGFLSGLFSRKKDSEETPAPDETAKTQTGEPEPVEEDAPDPGAAPEPVPASASEETPAAPINKEPDAEPDP
ncbi:MAG: hypothetical protein AAFU58_07105, partial [Pseudomonadota bacterium]